MNPVAQAIMRLNPDVTITQGGKHLKVVKAGMLVGILPFRMGKEGLSLNSKSQLRRAGITLPGDRRGKGMETEKPEVRYPDVTVPLTGQDGNIFFIMGRVVGKLRNAGATPEEEQEFVTELTDSDSYEAALRVVMRWVKVT